MITLNIVSEALLAPDPHTRMHDLVRAEMASGRKMRDIFNDINPILDKALETPGLSEEGEEALYGTLDALTGTCHPNCQYTDPPNNILPIEMEIAKLPHLASIREANS